MTKEEFIRIIKTDEATLTINQIDDFFESNVCIPKGENRQECADEIHAYAEGITVQRRSPIGWEDLAPYSMPLRIKPLDPIYEWQWKFKHPDSNATWDGYTMYATDEQFETIKMEWMKYQKDEETKRERK